MQTAALRRKLNPVDWIAYVLSIPFVILDRAGLTDDETPGILVVAYGWFVRIALLIAILAVTTYLGVQIPWEEILGVFK